MSDMKKLLSIVTESGEKARIDEGVNVSINVSGDSPCDVGEVLAKVTNLSSPRPVTPNMMPPVSSPPPMPMVKAIDIVGKGDGPAVPPAPPGAHEHPTMPPIAPEAIGQSVMMPDPSEEPTSGPKTSSQPGAPMGGANLGGGEKELEALISSAESDLGIGDDDEDEDPDAGDKHLDRLRGLEDESLLDPAMGSAHSEEECSVMPSSDNPGVVNPPVAKDSTKGLTANSSFKEIHDRLRAIDQALKEKNTAFSNQKDEDFQNKPDASYKDTEYMTKDLAGGLNKPKDMKVPMTPVGNNPMATKMEDIVRNEWEKYKLGE